VARLDQRLASSEALHRSTLRELATLEHGIEVLIRRDPKDKCAKEFERAWKHRYLYLRPRVTPESLAALGFPGSPGRGQELTKDEEKALAALCAKREGSFVGQVGALVDVSLPATDFCAAFKSFHLGTLRTGSMFASRQATLNASGVEATDALREVITAADAIAGAGAPMKVTITGHTDQVRLSLDVDGKTVGNEWLSEARAKAFGQGLQKGSLPVGVTLEIRGEADRHAIDCGREHAHNANHPCHAQNRRVTVAIDTQAFTVDYPCW
jgi:hypothetical protein